MARKRYTAEQIINHLREAEILISQSKSVREASRQIGITEQTYYRWRKDYGGMDVSTRCDRLDCRVQAFIRPTQLPMSDFEKPIPRVAQGAFNLRAALYSLFLTSMCWSLPL